MTQAPGRVIASGNPFYQTYQPPAISAAAHISNAVARVFSNGDLRAHILSFCNRAELGRVRQVNHPFYRASDAAERIQFKEYLLKGHISCRKLRIFISVFNLGSLGDLLNIYPAYFAYVKHCDISFNTFKYPELVRLIRQLSNLTSFSFFGSKEELLSIMDIFPRNLKTLKFSSFSEVDDECVDKIIQSFPELEKIVLLNTEVTGSGVRKIADQYNKQLRAIALGNGSDSERDYLDEKDLIYLFQQCTKLKSFCLKTPELSDEMLAVIGQNCPLIESVEIEGNRKITDKGLQALVQGCSNIRRLYLTGVSHSDSFPSITDVAMQAIGDFCPHLVKANFSYLKTITSGGLMYLLQKCRKLIYLDLSHTKFNDFDIYTMARSFSPLTGLTLLETQVSEMGWTAVQHACPTMQDCRINNKETSFQTFVRSIFSPQSFGLMRYFLMELHYEPQSAIGKAYHKAFLDVAQMDQDSDLPEGVSANLTSAYYIKLFGKFQYLHQFREELLKKYSALKDRTIDISNPFQINYALLADALPPSKQA